MERQLSFFDDEIRHDADVKRGAPYVAGSDTSQAAAEMIEPHLNTLASAVLGYVRSRGDQGATCDEAEQWLGMKHQTCSARIRELALAKLIYDSGKRRRTRSGASARVYLAPEAHWATEGLSSWFRAST